jgi:hypothetical protein
MVWPEPDPKAAPHPAAETGTVGPDSRAGHDPPIPGHILAALDRHGARQAAEACDRCGVAAVVERKCKVVCLNCGTILKSCADL